MSSSSRTYADAVACLNSLQTNFAVIDAIRKSGRKMNNQAIPEMIQWCKKIGYQPSEFDRLNPIHVAGTKGKGSTSAFISSILTQCRGMVSAQDPACKPISKVGLYTSPHLRFVRERIRINNQPLSEEQFAQYFFETWDRLETSASAAGLDPKDASTKPVYFRYLTLMAFHTYLSEGVDAAVIECGIGGEYDSTNVLVTPTATAITSLGIDHVGILGNTIEQIAWHKAGIMRKGVKCFTCADQKEAALKVLRARADEKSAELLVVSVDGDIESGETRLGLQAEFQKVNASLARATAKEWLQRRGIDVNAPPTVERIKRGLAEVMWSGRCEIRQQEGIKWCIDGGHTLESIELAGKWFLEQIKMTTAGDKASIRVLIFNQQTRDANTLAKLLHQTLANALGDEKPFTHAIFCTNTTYKETGFRPDLISLNTNASDVEELKVQRGLAKTWAEIDPSTSVSVVRTVEDAVQQVRTLVQPDQDAKEVIALVTGSLHLVGGFLEVIETQTHGK